MRIVLMRQARLRYDSGPACKAARNDVSGTGAIAPALLHNRQPSNPRRPPRVRLAPDGANARKRPQNTYSPAKGSQKNEAHHIAHSVHNAHSVPGAPHSPANSPHA
jgi:hypothetical protein